MKPEKREILIGVVAIVAFVLALIGFGLLGPYLATLGR